MSVIAQRRVRRTLRWVLLSLGFCLVSLLCVVLFRALSVESRQLLIEHVSEPAIDANRAALRLSKAIQIPTISTLGEYDSTERSNAFTRFHRFLSDEFPLAHATLDQETVGTGSLLYTWHGSGTRSIVLLAHHDVVPVDPGSAAAWSRPPFEGRIEEDFVWGRGALDNKAALLGIFTATELLIDAGFEPQCTVYIASSSNEEIRGVGAKRIAQLLVDRGVAADFVLDEGLLVTEDIVPGIDGPVALVGTSEKGFLRVELVAEGASTGHLAMPTRQTAVGRLTSVVAKIEDNPLEARLEGPAQELYRWLAPEMNLGMKLVASNLWLFGPLVEKTMASNPSTNAIVRTTAAPTTLSGSSRFNVMPKEARAGIVFFIHPSDSVQSVVDYLTEVAGDRVRIRVLEAHEPTPVSSAESSAFATLARSILETFPSAIVAPTLLVGNVDARHFGEVSGNIFRFSPMVARGRSDVELIHGPDERLSVNGVARVVRFYSRLIQNSCGEGAEPSALER